MSDSTFQVGDKVSILDVQKVGEVVEVLEDGTYKVEYTDDGGVVQTETAWEYPFKLNTVGNLLSLRAKLTAQSRAGMLYTFLLVASRADMDSQRKLENLDPATLFEQLCADVLLNFWGGKTDLSGSLVFGTARKKAKHNTQFHSNIEHLCTNLRDGRGMKPGAKTPGAGDGKLDVVVWRIFSDGRTGGLIGFGQCKTGIHWKTHLTKLQPRHFCGKYFQEPLIIDPIRVYMVPHRVECEGCHREPLPEYQLPPGHCSDRWSAHPDRDCGATVPR
jgi:hypothetical protein